MQPEDFDFASFGSCNLVESTEVRVIVISELAIGSLHQGVSDSRLPTPGPRHPILDPRPSTLDPRLPDPSIPDSRLPFFFSFPSVPSLAAARSGALFGHPTVKSPRNRRTPKEPKGRQQEPKGTKDTQGAEGHHREPKGQPQGTERTPQEPKGHQGAEGH